MKKIDCLICGAGLRVSTSQSRRSKHPKQFINLSCPVDGRHFRAFIADQEYVAEVIEKAGAASYAASGYPEPSNPTEEPA